MLNRTSNYHFIIFYIVFFFFYPGGGFLYLGIFIFHFGWTKDKKFTVRKKNGKDHEMKKKNSVLNPVLWIFDRTAFFFVY